LKLRSNSVNATPSCDLLLIYTALLNNVKHQYFFNKTHFKKKKFIVHVIYSELNKITSLFRVNCSLLSELIHSALFTLQSWCFLLLPDLCFCGFFGEFHELKTLLITLIEHAFFIVSLKYKRCRVDKHSSFFQEVDDSGTVLDSRQVSTNFLSRNWFYNILTMSWFKRKGRRRRRNYFVKEQHDATSLTFSLSQDQFFFYLQYNSENYLPIEILITCNVMVILTTMIDLCNCTIGLHYVGFPFSNSWSKCANSLFDRIKIK
jgi:hypothetical protein